MEAGARVAIILAIVHHATLIYGHAALITPPPRNAVDRSLAPWAGGRFGLATCEHPTGGVNPGIVNPLWGNGSCWGCNCVNGTQPCEVAQTCVYFSQGCSIGCASCDGQESNPNFKDRCSSGMKPTNNDPEFRTVNRDVPAMSEKDVYMHNPWRAPGNAPVYDACGMAGGGPTWVTTGLSFVDTKFAKQGALGSRILPPRPTGIIWTAGGEAEAKWNVRANHGGGYAYRLCPRGVELTEACFQQHPLPFSGQTFLEWGNGTRLAIPARILSNGTQPAGSHWAMNPLPFKPCYTSLPDDDPLNQGCSFAPPCAEHQYNGTSPMGFANFTGSCSGRFPVLVSIVDVLSIPADLTPGEYVLGFRYDAEMTAQVWQACADVSIVAPPVVATL